MTENEDADVDINLLSELLEMAENDDGNGSSGAACLGKEAGRTQTFDSILEDLDRIPVGTSSRNKFYDKTNHCSNNQASAATATRTRNSAVHAGDTDSSDDDEARKQGSTLDSFGASVKRMMKSAEEEKRSGSRLLDSKHNSSPIPSWKSQGSSPGSSTSSMLGVHAQKKTGPMDVYLEPSIGIRIVNPLVSSTVMKERLVGRKVVSFAQVKQFTSEGKITDDWVIFGVIVSKAPPRTSSKGTPYSIVKLSDLRGPGNPKTVSLFFFSSAFKKHGKEGVGSVIGILNPNVMENSRNHNDEACLSVDNGDRIMNLGTSKDFGMCKSKKKNGENCTAVVNVAQCEFCVYHVKQEYQKCSRRSDVQSSFNGLGLTNLRNKVLGKNEVFYGGQSFSSVPAKKSRKLVEKDENRLKALFSSSVSPALKATPTAKKGLATSVEMSHRQSAKDLERLRKLTAEDEKFLTKQSNVVTAQFNPGSVKPDEAKNAALAFIAKKKNDNEAASEQGEEEGALSVIEKSSVWCESDDAAVRVESVLPSRGLTATLALMNPKKSVDVTPSSLGLGHSPKTDCKGTVSSSDMPLSKHSPLVSSKSEHTPKPGKRLETPLKAAPKVNKTGSLSSKQLLKLASSGTDMESRMLKQAAQKAALKEEASKSNPHPTPSMLGLGRGSLNALPRLTKGPTPSGLIDFSAPISKKISTSAKLNAISVVKNKGGLSKNDPNHREFESRKKATKENHAVKRPCEDFPNTTSNVLKKFKHSPVEDDEESKKARFKKLMEASSRHSDLIEAAENEAQETYFGKLEKKEQMEEKMLNTFKVACKAVRCLTCKYTSFSASDKCKEEKHPLKVMDATKRFFKCADCGNRTVSLQVIPVVSCSNCSGSHWERTAMMREKKVGVSTNILSVRGMEETFIGSVTTGANVNLLVPEDGT